MYGTYIEWFAQSSVSVGVPITMNPNNQLDRDDRIGLGCDVKDSHYVGGGVTVSKPKPYKQMHFRISWQHGSVPRVFMSSTLAICILDLVSTLWE